MDDIALLRIFLSSPGDVAVERKNAARIIQQLNTEPLLKNVHLEVVAWDDPTQRTPMLATKTPQQAIDEGLPRPSECHIVVVLFWGRMGSELDVTTHGTKSNGEPYWSGTEWEYQDALHGVTENGTSLPYIVVYRRTDSPPSPQLGDPYYKEAGLQYERVEKFFADFYAEGVYKRGFNPYKTPEEFAEQFEHDLKVLINQVLQQQASGFNEAVQLSETKVPVVWTGSPFPGLRAFTPADEPIFFGRGQEVEAVRKQLTNNRLVAVIGASGSGKSSLVGAGLIPRLKTNAIQGSKDWLLPDWNAEAKQWVGLRFTPGEVSDDPFMALALKLGPLINEHPRDLAKKLAEAPQNFEKMCVGMFADHPDWTEALLFIDQFEELFTLVQPRFVSQFIDLLKHITESKRLRSVLTLRADFYSRCVEIPDLAELLKTATYPLAAPTTVELYEMITKPAERAGLVFENGLPERILADTGTEPGALALMAYALDELYHRGAGDQRLEQEEYELLGGVQGAIGKRAETVYSALEPAVQAALPVVFRELVEVNEQGEPTRRRAELARFDNNASAMQLINALTSERARLLVQDQDSQGRPLVEVAHEALLRQWSRLSIWIQNQQGNLRLRRRIRQELQAWETHGQSEDYLLTGGHLDDATNWAANFPTDSQTLAFIEASQQARKSAQRRTIRNLTIFGVSMTTASVLILALLVLVLNAQRTNEDNQVMRFFEAGNSAYEIENYIKAVAEYERAIDIRPDFTDALYRRAKANFSLGSNDAALSDLNYALELDPDNIEAHYDRGLVLSALNEFNAALDEFDYVLQHNPNFSGAYNSRGLLLLEQADQQIRASEGRPVTPTRIRPILEQAIDDFTHGLDVAPQFAEAYLNRGNAQITLINLLPDVPSVDYQTAIDDFTQALSIDPATLDAYIARSNAYSALGRQAEALADYNRWFDRIPKFTFERLPVDLENIQWWQYYGNTIYAQRYGSQFFQYSQGLHGGADFGNSTDSGVLVYAGVTGTFRRHEQRTYQPNALTIDVGEYTIIYGHLVNPRQFQVGESINPDTILGEIGSAGFDHLHLEVRYRQRWIVDPMIFMTVRHTYPIIEKFPPDRSFYYDADWTDWQTPANQPVITLGGPIIGPNGQ